MKILLIEDEPHLRAALVDTLHREHTVKAVGTGKDGLFEAEINVYDLIILDVSLPDITGFVVCQQLRQHKIATPILFLTAHADVGSRVRGLELGGDDYLIKPFSTAELKARIRALTRRPTSPVQPVCLTLGRLEVDTLTQTVRHHGHLLPIRHKEYLLLEYLVRHHPQVVGKEQLWQYAWDTARPTGSNVLDVHLSRLRRSMAPVKDVAVVTLRGQGYRLQLSPAAAVMATSA
jgi:DNA-binding response OmpR family regulator